MSGASVDLVPLIIGGLVTVAGSLGGAWGGAYIGATLANHGARKRNEAREQSNASAIKLHIFGALRVLQSDVEYVHQFGDFNARLGKMWALHQRDFFVLLRQPATVLALRGDQMEKLNDFRVRVETLYTWLVSNTAKRWAIPEDTSANPRADSAHACAERIKTAMDQLGIDYDRSRLVTDHHAGPSTSCRNCPPKETTNSDAIP